MKLFTTCMRRDKPPIISNQALDGTARSRPSRHTFDNEMITRKILVLTRPLCYLAGHA